MNAREKRLQERQQATPVRLPVLIDGAQFTPPATRGDCLPGGSNAARPCPWARCVHHLAVDVNPQTGRLQEHGEPESMEHTCALDVAEHSLPHKDVPNITGHLHQNSLDAIGALMGVTRERVRQLETLALSRLVDSARIIIGEPDRPVRLRSIRCAAARTADARTRVDGSYRRWLARSARGSGSCGS